MTRRTPDLVPGSRGVGLGPRLLLAQGLVILAGGATLLGVALVLAPGLFRTHLDRVAGPITDDLAAHLDEAFTRAVLVSLAVAMTAASVTALAVSWFVTRRVVRPMRAMAEAAELIAAGGYSARMGVAGAGTELDVLGRAFNRMAASLAATERTRAEMLRDLAHELRTPLTSIRGYVEAVADGVLPLDRDAVETIDSELARVERLVDDIATVSRAEERRLDLRLQRTEPADLVSSAVAAADRAFEERDVRLVPEVENGIPAVSVDRDRIHEVLANLLDNALRHTPAHGRVVVTARFRSGLVELAVADTGDGITAEQLPRVFERFYRVDDGRSRTRGGSGIGLAIARALVAAHGGNIRAQSPGTGAGSTFTVTLPPHP